MSTLPSPSVTATLLEPHAPAARASGGGAFNNTCAIAGVVIRELYRRKDFYVLFVITALITAIMGSVSIFSQDNLVRYLKEICLFLIWAAALVIAITAAARQLPAEREARTLFPLLAKPVTRSQLVLGKFLGCWLACGVALLFFYVFFGVVAGTREHAWPVTAYFQAATLHWFMLGIVCAMTLLGSVVLAAPSSTNTILLIVSVGILLVGRHLHKVALRLDEPVHTLVTALYYLLPHLEFFDVRDLIVHNWGGIPWMIWLAALGYAGVYAAAFLLAACLAFRRKAIH